MPPARSVHKVIVGIDAVSPADAPLNVSIDLARRFEAEIEIVHGVKPPHHLWPDLSMLSYQKAAPLVRAICAKHGVPYVQQSVFWRLKKTVDIMTGHASMRRFPTAFERQADLTEGRAEATVHDQYKDVN